LFASQVSSFAKSMLASSVIYNQDGVYQRIIIYNNEYGNRPARFLLLDRNPSAASFIGSDELVYDYTKYYAVYSVLNPNVKEALMIGGGGYSVPRSLLRDLPYVNIDVAEIEPSLFDLAKQYFDFPESPRVKNVVEDGRRLLASSSKKYDFIFSDAYSSIYSTPEHLTTQEFFTIAKDRLHDDGVFVANVIGNLEPKEFSLALSEIKTFKSVFSNSYFFAVREPGYMGLQNLIFVGYNSPKVVDMASPGIINHKNAIIGNLAEKQINIGNIDFSPYPLLTDDFAPTEYLTAKEL
jgi:spermidine synthase